MKNIDIHADDYALTINTSKDMLECMRQGNLDSISIICNMPCFDKCMDMFYEEIPNLPFLPLISVHIDLIEGDSVSEDVPLMSKDNVMSLSWKDVFFISFGSKKEELKKELKKEIKAQIDKVWDVTKKCMEIAKENNVPCEQKAIRIDSHQHIHSLPIVWEALMEVIEENNYEVEYIRNPKEPLMPFVSELSLWSSYRPINFVKNRLLMFYSKQNDEYCGRNDMQKMYMWGLVMSGKMDIDRIRKLYPKMVEVADKNNRRLEILFHPGMTLEEEKCNEIAEDALKDFYLSENRHIEKDAVMKTKKELVGA